MNNYDKFIIFAGMIELAQHIEVLLLGNDCVIVPGFGGFVAHYTPATRVQHEDTFLPPSRTIGFNPQLKLNDGVLAQSYMTLYDTNFSDAVKRIEKEVKALMSALYEDGKVNLGNIGEIRYTMRNTYEFVSFNHKMTSPHLYGLDSFKMKELATLKKTNTPVAPHQSASKKKKKSYEIRVNRAFLRHTAAAVAAVVLFFMLSTPIENTYIEKENYAQLLPADLFEKIEKESVTTTPIRSKVTNNQNKVTTNPNKVAAERNLNREQQTTTKPIAVREVKVTAASNTPSVVEVPSTPVPAVNTPASPTKKHHLIVAGSVTLKNAEALAESLQKEGFSEAAVLNTDGKVRVSIMSFSTHEEATKELLQLRKNEAYQNAWLLVK